MWKPYVITVGFILFDIVTGIVKALSKEGLNSTILRKGLFHKLSEILALLGGYLFELACQYIDIGINMHLSEGISLYICIMEAVSIFENISAVNPKLAKFFAPYLEKLKGKESNE